MDIFVARHSGFCFGVKRAVDMVRDLVAQGKGPIHVLGHLIHNPTVVQELARQGVRKAGSLGEVQEGILVIRSHGVPREVLEEATQKGLTIVDTTCPNVKLAQDIAQKLSAAEYQVLIVGDKGHAEVEGILSYTAGRGIVVDGIDTLEGHSAALRGKRIGVLCQTTIHIEKLRSIVDFLIGHNREIVVHNTICDVTTRRQASTLDLARTVDLMIVIGGKESANTTRLAEISMNTGVATYHVESEHDLSPAWFHPTMKVGLTAGASTPSELLEAVKAQILAWERNGKIG